MMSWMHKAGLRSGQIKGTFVCNKFQALNNPASKDQQELLAAYPSATGYKFRKSILLDLSVTNTEG